MPSPAQLLPRDHTSTKSAYQFATLCPWEGGRGCQRGRTSPREKKRVLPRLDQWQSPSHPNPRFLRGPPRNSHASSSACCSGGPPPPNARAVVSITSSNASNASCCGRGGGHLTPPKRGTEEGGGSCAAVGRKGSPSFQPCRHPPHYSCLGASPGRCIVRRSGGESPDIAQPQGGTRRRERGPRRRRITRGVPYVNHDATRLARPQRTPPNRVPAYMPLAGDVRCAS